MLVKLADENRMIGLPYGEKNYDDMLSRFHLIPERYGQTDRFAISISRVSMLTRDKNGLQLLIQSRMGFFEDWSWTNPMAAQVLQQNWCGQIK